MASARTESRATAAGKWLLALVVPASAQALGSLPVEVLVAMSALAALSCGLLWMERDNPTSRASRWVLLAMAVLLAMTVVQAIPLPAGVARALTPANGEIWDRALSPLHELGPAWHTLSIAPAATRVEVLKGFFYCCVFLAALRVASLERGEQFLVRLVVFSTCVMAISALAHMAVSAERVYGVYRPRELYAYRAGRLAPLLNTNHLAAYLNIGACVALWALVARRSMPRPLSASAALVLVGTSVWQGSRGAVGALLFGAILTIGLTLYVKRRFDSRRAEAAILGACAVAAAFMVSVALSDVAREHLVSREYNKYAVAKASFRLVASSPWFGVGRGGFESIFSSVREGTTYYTWTHPENGMMQWFVEWGVPLSIASVAILGWALRPQLVLRAVRPAVGAWVAVVAAVLHDLVDFHFEVPGVVALGAVCVAIVVSGRVSSREATPTDRWPAMRYAASALVAGTGLAVAFVWPAMFHTLAEDRRHLSELAVDKAASREQFTAAIRAAILRYPSEPFFPLMGAVRAQVNEEGSVVPWVGRALERDPHFGRAHFVLARSLGSSHAAQARLEYRLAYENDVQLRDQIVKEGLRLVEDADTALEMVPEGPAGVDVLRALVVALADRRPSTAVLLDREIERRSPEDIGPLRRRVEAAVSDAADEASWCARKECVRDGLSMAATVSEREPARCESHVLVARLKVLNGDVTSALDGLERSLDTVTDRPGCQRQLITLALGNGQTRRGDMALERLIRGGCGASADCSDLYAWAGGVEEGRGHFVSAVRLYKLILQIAPEREDLLQHIGELGVHDGALGDAVDAYASLSARHPADPQWLAKAAALRAARVPPSPVVPP
ncbi:hypothetical protein BH11MYX4_BH11MYX4_35670 [soil metagenome]